MADLAAELGVSKKTLYKHFSDKNDVVYAVMEQYLHQENEILGALPEQFDNAMDEMIAISKHVTNQLKSIHPSIHFDLEKYHPDAWKLYRTFKKETVYQSICENLRRGIQQGLYRENLNVTVIGLLYIAKIDLIFDPGLFPHHTYRFEIVFLEMMQLHLRGISSALGLEYLNENFNNQQILSTL